MYELERKILLENRESFTLRKRYVADLIFFIINLIRRLNDGVKNIDWEFVMP